MSDYFIRMVERALGGEPAVRPLVPPACVPGPAGAVGIGGGEDSHGIEEIRASFPLEQKVPEPDGAEPHSPPAAKGIARSKPAEVSHFTAPPADSQQLQPAGLAPAIVPSAEGRERGAGIANAVKDASWSADPFPGPTHASENGPDSSQNVADGVKMGNENAGSGIFETVLHLMRHREAQQHREFLMGREESRIGPPWEPESAEAAEPEHDIAESILRGTGSVTLHKREQLFPRAAERFSAPKESPPSPTIKVSIGRIEIRATAPQVANAESRRPPAPKLSLDDYLKKQPGRTR